MLEHLRPVGRGASAKKYDLLTALGAHALAANRAEQRRVLRLMTLITARYNWSKDELAVGQREIARLWACDERTVKREMARLKAMGWLVVRRQGARGRVSEYRIDVARVFEDTRPVWSAVGPDFEARLAGAPEEVPGNVVPMPIKGNAVRPDVSDTSEWGTARFLLHDQDPGLYAAWLHGLSRDGRAGGRLTLRAPSRFHASYVATHLANRVLAACREVDPTVDTLEVLADSR